MKTLLGIALTISRPNHDPSQSVLDTIMTPAKCIIETVLYILTLALLIPDMPSFANSADPDQLTSSLAWICSLPLRM